jgi:hypothetical protein
LNCIQRGDGFGCPGGPREDFAIQHLKGDGPIACTLSACLLLGGLRKLCGFRVVAVIQQLASLAILLRQVVSPRNGEATAEQQRDGGDYGMM